MGAASRLHRFGRRPGLHRVACLVVVVAAAAFLCLFVVAPASAANAWVGSGTGSTSVSSDGSSGSAASFTYSVNPGNSGSWRFSTTAAADGAVVLSYTYSGFHAFFQVRVGLSAFVTSGGVTTNSPLVNDGPVNCCTPPSGGFSYTGTVTLSVHAGDTFGFDMTGSNADSDRRLLGTLTITDLTPAPDRLGYCSVAGNSDPFTGKGIPAGTFLDLLTGQPQTDAHYLGATPAIFVDGRGITCDPPPPGYVRSGFAGDQENVSPGLYPRYTAP